MSRTTTLWLRAFWKEWRDHRGMTIAIAITIPVLSLIAFWAFGEKLGDQSAHTLALVFVPVPIGLVFLAIASDLVAGEHRGRTLDLLRRLPGALNRAFVVKWIYLLALTVAFVLWQFFVLVFCLELFTEIGSVRDGFNTTNALYGQLSSFPQGTWWQLTLVGMVLPPWAFVVSTWLGRSGAAAIASLIVLAAVLAPWAWMLHEHPWFLPFERTDAPRLAALLIGMALLVAAVSWLGGLRWFGARWKPALLGLACVLLLSGGGYLHAQGELADWVDFGPEDKGFIISSAHLGADGRTVYMNVHRGVGWWGNRAGHGGGGRPAKGTPVQAWTVDMETGTHTRHHMDGLHTFGAMGLHHVWSIQFGALGPQRVIHRFKSDGDHLTSVQWIDTLDASVVATLPYRTTSRETSALIREAAKARTRVRDSQGRRVWVREGQVEREGVDLAPLEDRIRKVPEHGSWHSTVSGGWFVYEFDKDARRTRHVFVRAEDGARLEVSAGKDLKRFSRGLRILSPTRALQKPLPKLGRPTWTLEDLVTGEVVGEAKNPPLRLIRILAPDRVLVMRAGPEGGKQAHLWDPETGASDPIRAEGLPAGPNVSVALSSWLSDGRVLLSVTDRGPGGTLLQGMLLLDVPSGKGRMVMPVRAHDQRFWHAVSALDYSDVGGLLGVEANRRIVRWKDGERTVVWPRTE